MGSSVSGAMRMVGCDDTKRRVKGLAPSVTAESWSKKAKLVAGKGTAQEIEAGVRFQ